MPQLINQLSQTRAKIDSALKEKLHFTSMPYHQLIEAMHYSLFAGGKAVRPFLTLNVAAALGLSEKIALDIACAIEIMHTYSLIHDDLPAMDNDTLRRGKPTNHIQFDEATAILAGDALQTFAFEILSHPKMALPCDIKCQLMYYFSKSAGYQGMIGGQIIDLIGEKQALSLDTIYLLNTLKTGKMIEFSCIAPALAIKANPDILSALQQYAYNLGLLFQTTDDILDETSTAQELGKTPGKDKKAGKSTFISQLGLTGTQNLAKTLHQKAIDSLHHTPILQPALCPLADFVLTRKK